MKMVTPISLSLLVALAAQVAYGGPYEEAKEALEHGDYATATLKYKQAAEEYTEASLIDGMDEYRHGVFASAAHKLRKSADQGNPHAQVVLGGMYVAGEGVGRDVARGYFWYVLAASQGNSDAIRNRDALVSGMTPQQIKTAEVLAQKWRPQPISSVAVSKGKRQLSRQAEEKNDETTKNNSVEQADVQANLATKNKNRIQTEAEAVVKSR